MIAFSETVHSFGLLLIIVQSLLVILQLYLCILTFRQRRNPALVLLSSLHLLLGTFLLSALLDGIFPASNLGRPRAYPWFVTAAYGLPWLLFAGLELLSAVLLWIVALDRVRYMRANLSAVSIKEAVDHLPAGICFGAPDGTVVLENLRMNSLSRSVTGHSIPGTEQLWQQLLRAGEDRGGQCLVRLADGSAFLFDRQPVPVDGQSFDQITASDVTEQYRITAELQASNGRLRDIQLRTKAYYAMASDMIITQEILSARRNIHDGVGQALLTQQYYLENPEKIDESNLLSLLRQTNTFLLREAEEEDDLARDAYLEALRLSAAIGVEVRVAGPVPESGAARSLLGQAIRECAANTVKHAGGSILTVELSEESGALTASLSNNGRPPETPIRETGGLLSLRRMVEQAGGSMFIQYPGAFRLTLILPRETP